MIWCSKEFSLIKRSMRCYFIKQNIFLCICMLLQANLPLLSDPSLNYAMKEILSSRFSGYKFDPTRLIASEKLEEILEAGRLAPSSFNEQPWNFIVCDRMKNPIAFKKLLDSFVPFNQDWAKKASVLIICIACDYTQKGTINRWSKFDTGAAVFAMMLQATAMGLMAHQIGGFDEKKVRSEFKIPKGFDPIVIMALGYQLDEIQPKRNRKPLYENFFMERWGKSFCIDKSQANP